MSAGRTNGRPLKFETVEEMQEKIDAYFKDCKKNKRPHTMSGLAYALDISRQTLLNYEERGQGFLDAISRARHKIQLFAEESLYDRERFKGAQFSLINNHGFANKLEVKSDVSLSGALDAQLIEGRQKVRKELKTTVDNVEPVLTNEMVASHFKKAFKRRSERKQKSTHTQA